MDQRRGGFTANNTSRPPLHATPDQYRAYVGKMTRAGNYVPLPRLWCHCFGLTAASCLANLLSAAQANAASDGFVMATPSWFCRGLGIDRDAEREAIGTLLNREILEERIRGGERHLRVNLARLDMIVKENMR